MMRTRRLCWTGCLAALALGWSVADTVAQSPSSEEIVRKLAPTVTTQRVRSFTRGVVVEEVKEPVTPSKHTIDLYVNFAYDSAKLTSDARITLRNLGTAMVDPRLTDYRFQLAGHTDARGTDAYNQDLSERRARAVRDFLVRYYRIGADRFDVAGYGESRLLLPHDPENGANRRVQVTNVGEVARDDPQPAPPSPYQAPEEVSRVPPRR